MKTVSKILIGVGAAVISVPVTLDAYLHIAAKREIERFARTSPIAAGLPREKASDEFQRRIQDRFPIGTPQNELVSTLASQGFQLEQGNDEVQRPYRWMHLTKFGDVVTDICRRDWYVSWQADANGQLTIIDTDYSISCS